jgi:hypothetical protein
MRPPNNPRSTVTIRAKRTVKELSSNKMTESAIVANPMALGEQE